MRVAPRQLELQGFASEPSWGTSYQPFSAPTWLIFLLLFPSDRSCRRRSRDVALEPRLTCELTATPAQQFIQAHDLPPQIPPRSSPQLRQLRQSRQPATRGQPVDKPWQNLRQLSGEFFLREA